MIQQSTPDYIPRRNEMKYHRDVSVLPSNSNIPHNTQYMEMMEVSPREG